MTDVVSVIQARMGSTRRPGKVLADLGGEPMLAFMIRRLRTGDIGTIVVATSTAPVDDPLVELARGLGVTVVRGSEHDVLARFLTAVEAVPASTVVRLTADCPLHDPAVVAAAVEHHRLTEADYTSNTLVRTFPVGLDVEVMRAEMLAEAADEATDPDEREHVTPFFYRRPDRYVLEAFRNDEPLGDERWTVDTEDDLERVREIVARMPVRVAGWRDILSVAGFQRHRRPGELFLQPAAESIPAARVWEVRRDDRILGRLRVRVSSGVGVLDAELPDDIANRAHDLLRDALRSDRQVRELRSDGVTSQFTGRISSETR